MQTASTRSSRATRTKIKKIPSYDEDDEPLDPTVSSTNTSSFYISTFTFLIFALLIYDLIVLSNVTVDFEAVKAELIKNVHNQSSVVNVVIESLDSYEKYDKSVNTIFFGSSGVGKTFIANIIKKYFQPSVYELSGRLSASGLQEILKKLKGSSYKHNLIVIDDLSVVSVDKLLLFIERIPEEVVVFIISIFNIQETDDSLNHNINYDHINKVVGKFNLAQIPHQTAGFREFSKEDAGDWIIKQLTLKGIESQSHTKLIESVLERHDVKYHGLKGLSSKLNLQL